jgi:hypothetical protein
MVSDLFFYQLGLVASCGCASCSLGYGPAPHSLPPCLPLYNLARVIQYLLLLPYQC